MVLLRKTTAVLLLAFLFSTSYFGQNTYATRKAERFAAFKFGELGELPSDQWQRELARYLDAASGYPSGSLVIFVYARKGSERTSIDKIVSEYSRFLKDRAGEGVSVSVSPNGFRGAFTAELWIVSKHDGRLPESTPDEYFEPEKFDEVEDVADDKFVQIFNVFREKSAKQPSFQLYVINYGTVEEIARRERLIADNVTSRGHDRSRMTLVNGGARTPSLTVFWFVPPGGRNPTP